MQYQIPENRTLNNPLSFDLIVRFDEDFVQMRYGDQPVLYHIGRENNVAEMSNPPPKFF